MKETYENIIVVQKLRVVTANNPKKILLDDISFSIKKNKITALVGKSGSGKSLTALSISGLIKYIEGLKVEGEVLFNGVEENILMMSNRRLEEYRGKMISMIFQDPISAFNPSKRCGEQLEEILKSNGIITDKKPKEFILELFSELEVEKRLFDSYPHTLSGGQLQRISIIASVLSKPKMIIADEPVTNLDADAKKGVLDLLKKVNKDLGITILYISHNIDAVKYIADDILAIQNNQVISRTMDRDISSDYDIVLQLAKSSGSINTGVKILEVKSVSKIFSNDSFISFRKKPEVIALDNVSFDVYEGDIFGVIGESGSGKSTLARLIMNLLPKDSGEILLDGIDLSIRAKEKTLYNDIQIVFQNPLSSLNPALSVKRLLEEAIIAGNGKSHDKESIEREVKYLLSIVNLQEDILIKSSTQISGGEGQRVALARALAVKPRLIVFDESLSSLDRDLQIDILELLLKLRIKLNLTYIFITHDLNICRVFCNKKLVLQKGKVV